MTVQEMLIIALNLLGYTDRSGNEQLTSRITNRAVELVNTIYVDLWRVCHRGEDFTRLKGMGDKIDLPNLVLNDVMPYGVAAMFALGENDTDQEQLWARRYNEKRGTLTYQSRYKNVLPSPWEQ